MIIMLLLTIALCVYSVVNFKKAVFLVSSVFILQMHLNSGIGVRQFYVVSAFQIVWFLFQYAKAGKALKYPQLLSLPCLLATIGYLISSYYGVKKQYADIVLSSLCLFGYPAVLYKTIKTRSDLQSCLKILFAFFVIIGLYAIAEEITRYNLYSQILVKYNLGKGFYGGVFEKVRYGLRRCNSLLAFCSTLGFTASITFFLVLYCRISKIVISRRMEDMLLLLMPVCVLLSGTRSQFVVFFICLFPFIFWNRAYKSRVFKFYVILAFVAVSFFSEFFGQIAESILFSDEASTGSSSEMRENQFEICYFFFQQSPIWGWGKDYILDMAEIYTGLLGAESIWFRMMVDYGIVGCITYTLIVLGTAVWVARYDKRFVFIPLAYIAGKTVSIVVGIEPTYLMVVCILLQKIYVLYGLGNSSHEYLGTEKLLWVRSMHGSVQ